MRIVFRADASPAIGAGHVMRCLALARELMARGAECVFLSRAAGLGDLVQRIAGAGMGLLELPEAGLVAQDDRGPATAHAAWLPGGWRFDAESCRRQLGGRTADWLVVDHYALDAAWERVMRDGARRILAIDDLADRRHEVDVLLDQNLMAAQETRYADKLPASCRTLLGPGYAMLRPEFVGAGRGREHPGTGPVRLLVMFGGADAANLTLRCVRLLAAIGWSAPVDVVAGPLYADLPALRAALEALPGGQLLVGCDDIAGLMRRADLALGSPAGTSWERCACALPCLAIAQAANQEPIGEALHAWGAHHYLGRAEMLDDETLRHELVALAGDPERRAAMARRALELCDGEGVRRVAAVMEELS